MSLNVIFFKKGDVLKCHSCSDDLFQANKNLFTYDVHKFVDVNIIQDGLNIDRYAYVKCRKCGFDVLDSAKIHRLANIS